MKRRIETWWDGRSATFTRLTGESFSHGEVVMAAVVVMLMLLACGLAETMGG